MSRLILGICGVALVVGLTTPAAASFRICNRTAYPASVALGFFDGEDWASRGWWRIAGGDCAELVEAPLFARYYYVYAVHEVVGGAWDGNRTFCVGTESFHIRGREDCLSRNFDRKRFFQVDTGDAIEWTESLSD